MGIADVINQLRYPCYNCARVNVGTYKVGDGMGAGTLICCQWQAIKGEVFSKRLKSIRARDGNHDRTISHLETFVLYPLTDIAVVEVSNRHGCHRICLIKNQKGKRSNILKERL